jgi:hypothetical protein
MEGNVEAILFSLHPLRKEIAAFLGAKGTGTDVGNANRSGKNGLTGVLRHE